MESSRGRGGRPWLPCVDDLIAFRVTQLFVNVWWQGYIPYSGEIGLYGFGKLDQAFRTIQHFNNLRPDFNVSRHWVLLIIPTTGVVGLQKQLLAYTQTLPPDQRFPGPFIAAMQK